MDDVDSALICRMAERVSEGKLSVRAAAECAQTFIQDGGSKVPGFFFRLCSDMRDAKSLQPVPITTRIFVHACVRRLVPSRWWAHENVSFSVG